MARGTSVSISVIVAALIYASCASDAFQPSAAPRTLRKSDRMRPIPRTQPATSPSQLGLRVQSPSESSIQSPPVLSKWKATIVSPSALIGPPLRVPVDPEVVEEERDEIMTGGADVDARVGGASDVRRIPRVNAAKVFTAAYWRECRKRMWTSMDWLHLHAVSGVLFMGLGTLWFGWELARPVLGVEGAFEMPSPLLPWRADSASMTLLMVAILNCFTCIPMSKFRNGHDTKGDGFKGLGTGMTLLAAWEALWVSGYYPPVLEAATPAIATAFLATIVHGIWTSEKALEGAVHRLDAKWARGSSNRETSLSYDEMRNDIVLNHRVASYPNLLHLPILWNIGIGGRGWLDTVLQSFPGESALLYDAAFGMALANSIVFLGATLKDRRLMTLREWLALQLVVLAPFVSTVVDCCVYGDSISVKPWEVYAGLV